MTHDVFAQRLSKLPLLHKAHFGSEPEKTNVQKILNEEVFTIGHAIRPNQLRHFKTNGEVTKLLKLCSSRFDRIVSDIDATEKFDTVFAFLASDWFAFDPSAYALTYELERKTSDDDASSYAVIMATPALRGLYSGDVAFKTMDDAATFLDSILIHEIAHCVGSMKHDGEFKKAFKEICKIEGVVPII